MPEVRFPFMTNTQESAIQNAFAAAERGDANLATTWLAIATEIRVAGK